MIKPKLLLYLCLPAVLAACGGANAPRAATQAPGPTAGVTTAGTTILPSPTLPASATVASASPAPLQASTPDASPTPTLAPDAWKSMPVVPIDVSQRVREIYAHGQSLGNNPKAFSKIGDCDTSASWFLEAFDQDPSGYALGDYSDLQPVIDQFHGSFARISASAVKGAVAASVLSPIWNTSPKCEAAESPLACEVRLNRPSFAFVSLGTNDVYHRQDFEPNMRIILNTLIDDGVVPILATKADNVEGDYSLNATIARLAYEYDLPLWNFWAAVQTLPAHGLQTDGSHLTFAPNIFNNPVDMQAAWPWRNLTALQTLNVVWHGAAGQP